MRRLLAVGMVVVVALSCIAPLLVVSSTPHVPLTQGIPVFPTAVTFPTALNTSVTVPEYPLVSRALMLPGGSTDAALGDLNGDNLTDLAVAVSGTKCLAVFFRQSDNSLPSNPSLTISLSREPISISVAEVFSTGLSQIIVLEKKNGALDSDRIEFYNLTSGPSYELVMDRQPLSDADEMEVNELTGDEFPDIVLTLPGSSPSSVAGRVQILVGPYFSNSVLLAGGLGTNSVALLDANNDSLRDIALANYYASSVIVYEQPFVEYMPPSQLLAVSGNPISLASGKLDGDSSDDLVLSTYNQSERSGSLRYYFQSLGNLALSESLNASADLNPSDLNTADLDGDGGDELVLALSLSDNKAAGFLRKSSSPIWRAPSDILFPAGIGPRTALFGSFDSTGRVGVAISSARADGSGSSLMVLPDVLQRFSNSNGTVWTNGDAFADSVCVGDVNGDGVTDFVLRYFAANAFSYQASGVGLVSMVGLGYAPSHLFVTDLNRDGYDDVLTTSAGGNKSTLYFGSVSGPSNPMWFTSLGNITDVDIGDLNHDSYPDIVVSSDRHALNVFFNSGNVAMPFLNSTLVPITTQVGAIAVDDFDLDGKDDVAYSHPPRAISILLQKDSDPFLAAPADLVLSAPTGSDFSSIWSGDITGDGAADLVGMMPSDPKMYLFDQADFVLSPHPYSTLNLPEVPRFASVIDVTDDGHADVVATFNSADMLFLYRQSAGSLPSLPSMVFATGADPNWVAVGDGTGDGRVDLLVNNAESHSVSAWEMINSPPVAVAGGPYHGSEGDPVTLTGSAVTQTSEIPITDFYWDFGDGNVSGWSHSPVSSHVYAMQRTYNATLTVRDPFNSSFINSSVASVVISDGVPHVSFTWSPLSPAEGQWVRFNDTSTSFDAIVEINWSEDEVLISSGLSHSASCQLDDGIHNITLQIEDADGSVNSTVRSVTVSRAAPVVSISSVTSASEGTQVMFYAVVDPWHTSVDSIRSYEWNFSFTSFPFVAQFSPTPTSANNTWHSFQSSAAHANYSVALKVTDIDWDVAYAFTNITIFDRAVVTVSYSNQDPLHEFEQINFTATVDSAYNAVSYDWDFDSDQIDFQVELTTPTGVASHTYAVAGYYPVTVRVLMSNGSFAYGSWAAHPLDVVLAGSAEDLVVARNSAETSNVSFDATELAAKYPDIDRTYWEFGDSATKESASGPASLVYHTYVADRDYIVTLTLEDDDGTVLVIQKTLKLKAPVIDLRSPEDDSIVRSGTNLSFSISDDSQSLAVRYSVDGDSYQNFTTQWEVSTVGWPDGRHSVIVRAEDPDGNIALGPAVLVTIDDRAPALTVGSNVTSVFGGSKLNITATVDDPNIAADGVLLYVKFPGDDSYSSFPMTRGSGNEFYRVIEVPSRAGTMEYYIAATDLASNSAQTSAGTVEVKLHIADVALPYLLLAMVLAVIGTAGYFMHESRIAVDETFVIYNDGRLISHSTRRLKPGMDDQILGGMLAAIQDFVKESFKDVTSFNIRKLEFGDKSVLIEKGDNLFLAVILHGKASKKVASRMRRVVAEIEDRFEEHLTDWDGDLDKVRGVTDIVKKLYSKAPLLASSLNRRDT